jgi:hypothetical protein
MPQDPDEIVVQLWPLRISAKGSAAILIVALPIGLILVAVAWRIASGSFNF